MPTTTTTSPRDFAAEREQLRIQRRRAAFDLSRQTVGAAERLATIEAALERLAYEEELAALAAEEAQVQAAEEAERESDRQRESQITQHRELCAQRLEELRKVQTLTDGLADAVRQAIAIDEEVWALSLRLEWAPERRTKEALVDYVFSRLGVDGGAGLPMPYVRPAARGLLVEEGA